MLWDATISHAPAPTPELVLMFEPPPRLVASAPLFFPQRLVDEELAHTAGGAVERAAAAYLDVESWAQHVVVSFAHST